MDLHFTSAKPSLEERAVIDAAQQQARGDNGLEERTQRTLVLPLLHAVQDRFGWISPGALNYVSERLRVAPADVYGVATFYASLSTTPTAQRTVHVCDDIACIGEAEAIVASLRASGAVVERSPCLGLCDRAPASLGPDDAWVTTYVGGSDRRLLRRAGSVDPESLDDYRAADGFAALRKALELGPERVIAEVNASNLLGRGGAAFPMGRKMESVARAPERPHYLVCNADESEPGTFKDRVLMECDPFSIVEAMTIAGIATGCEYGYIYVRGEYPFAARRISNAIARAREAGMLGGRIMGTPTRFDIEVRRGAGAYICGEETALFNSIEGKRGEPRSKPPFPVQSGLFGKPTLINNVETLANLPLILLEGGERYAQTGTPQSAGTRLFSLSGSVAWPGVYEVPHGTTLGRLIELAGGVTKNRSLQAILLGGAAGTFVGPGAQDMPLTFEDARAAGATLGSGVVMLFDDRADMMAILRRIARFFQEESCGQCVPCRIGTVRQAEALQREDFTLLDDIGAVMRDASICGLGQTAANAIQSAGANLKLW